jgi:glyoxylase-like metal-dependent hydrolase (beta-lactamase superfamily II)
LKANCYILDDEAGTAIVLDPGDDSEGIVDYSVQQGLHVKAILATHGHIDHIGAVPKIKRALGCPFYLHSADMEILAHGKLYAFALYRRTGVEIPGVDGFLDTLDHPLRFGGLTVEVYATPGHTPGSICFQVGDHLFTGDTLLADRGVETGWPGGDPKALRQSQRLLSCLPGGWLIYPGHGEPARLSDALWRAAHR